MCIERGYSYVYMRVLCVCVREWVTEGTDTDGVEGGRSWGWGAPVHTAHLDLFAGTNGTKHNLHKILRREHPKADASNNPVLLHQQQVVVLPAWDTPTTLPWQHYHTTMIFIPSKRTVQIFKERNFNIFFCKSAQINQNRTSKWSCVQCCYWRSWMNHCYRTRWV